MPIASFKPEAVSPIDAVLPTIEPTDYKSVTVDNNVKPLGSLISYVEGAPWTVEYYSQVLGEHSDLREYDSGQSAAYQPYQRIKNLEIRVTAPLTGNQDEETATMVITGSAICYPYLIPNAGDVFIASTATANLSLFQVTKSLRKSFQRLSVYEIEYTMVAALTTVHPRYLDLQSKVIKDFYFHKDRMMEGLTPLLIPEDHDQLLQLEMTYGRMVRDYFRAFYNPDVSSLVVPGQTIKVYDHHLTNYVLRIVEVESAEEINRIRQITSERDPFVKQDQFWTAMIQREVGPIYYGRRKMGLLSVKVSPIIPVISSLRYSGIDYMVYPIYPDTSIRTSSDPYPYISGEITITPTLSGGSDLPGLLGGNRVIIDGVETPLIYPVTRDDYYVLSQSFYEERDDTSVLERLVWDYLKGNALSLSPLTMLVQQYYHWPRLEQFYYGPILLTLIKAARMGLYA